MKKWLVIPTDSFLEKQRTSIIPIFRRVRSVTFENNHLKCSCPRTHVFGDICIHMLKVATSIKSYKGPSHHDLSVVWWKKFYNHTLLEIKERPCENDLSKYVLLLRSKELCGIHIDGKTISQAPIHNGALPAPYFYDPSSPRCINYTLDAYDLLLDPIPAGLSQVSNVSNNLFENDEELLQNFMNNDAVIAETIEQNPQNGSIMDVYPRLIASFKELCNIYRGNCTEDDITEMKSILLKKIAEMKARVFQENKGLSQDDVPLGNIVSSNVPCSKRRKTHGNKTFH